jgi:hypothetical protein
MMTIRRDSHQLARESRSGRSLVSMTTRPQSILNERLAAVERELALIGFRRRGSTFRRKRDGNWTLLNFQKSSKTTADQVVFTINLGSRTTFSSRVTQRRRRVTCFRCSPRLPSSLGGTAPRPAPTVARATAIEVA